MEAEQDQNKIDFELLRHRSSPSSTASSDKSTIDLNVWPLHLTPNFIRHYITGEIIGSGSYAEVRECVDTFTLERLAMKIVNKDYLRRQAPGALANQLQEIKLLRRLHHTNIVVMRDCLTIGSYIYIILEYCSFNLSDLLAEQSQAKLDPSLARDFFHQICSGVSYLHSTGIVHRDIKPQNMLINNNGILKIIDFGVAQILSIWQRSATCKNYEGSPLFQAPEVVAAMKEYVGTKVDVWSCGVTLYLMLFGEYPFMHEALLGLYDKILGQNFRIPQGPPGQAILSDLLSILLDKDYRRRATIDEVLQHPWLNLQHAAGSNDDDDEDSEFIDFVLSSAKSHISRGPPTVTQEAAPSVSQPLVVSKSSPLADVYKSMSVLPYLYRHHFPKLPLARRNSSSSAQSERILFQAKPEDNESHTLETSDQQKPSSSESDYEDENVQWGTREQYELMKLPQVRANRLKFGRGRKFSRQQERRRRRKLSKTSMRLDRRKRHAKKETDTI